MFQSRAFVSLMLGAAAWGALASDAAAQESIDIDYGRFGIETLAMLSPSLVYRPIDMLGVRSDGRALGMGGAYVALADDPLAVAWNPAGIAGVREFTLAVDGFGIRESSTSAGFPATLAIPRVPELFITSYNASLKNATRYGTLGLAVPLWERGERRVVGGFAWRRFAEVGRPEETLQTLVVADGVNTSPVTIAFDRRERGAIDSFGPSLAFRLVPGLDLGVTANFLSGRNTVSQTFEQETGGQGLSDLGIERFGLEYRGFAFDLGARYDLGNRVRLALRYTPEYDLEVTGGAWRNETVDVTSFLRLRRFGTLSGYDQTIPALLNAGAGVRVLDRLWLSADYAQQPMSETSLTYTGAPASTPIVPEIAFASVGPELIEYAFGAAPAAGAPFAAAADYEQISFGAEYVLLRRADLEVPVRAGFRSTDLPYLTAASEDYSYRYLHEEVMELLGLDYEELLRLYDPSWDSNSTRARKVPKYTTVGVRYNGPHGEQPTGTGFSAGVSLRTDRVSYDLGIDWFSYDETRFYMDSIWDPIFSPNPSDGDEVESTIVGEGEDQEWVELPASVRHPSIIDVERKITTFRLSATYSFPDLF